MLEQKALTKLITRRRALKTLGFFTDLATIPLGLILAKNKENRAISDANIFNSA